MPPTGRILLDTNMLIALLAEEPAVVRGVQEAEAVHVPAIALGELHYGARKSTRAAQNVERVNALAARSAVLACDAATAASYGKIKAALRAKGTPIPENDLWIAALAQQHDLTVASRDEHFDVVPGLVRVAWTAPPSTPP
jgi:tRNA(fMet)-specific endonuclease VapC